MCYFFSVIVTFASLGALAVHAESGSREAALPSFESWLSSAGISHDRVRIDRSNLPGDAGLGVFAREDVPVGGLVVSVPREAAIFATDLDSSTPLGAAVNRVLEPVAQNSLARLGVILASALAGPRGAAVESDGSVQATRSGAFGPYLDLLPTGDALPSTWTLEERRLGGVHIPIRGISRDNARGVLDAISAQAATASERAALRSSLTVDGTVRAQAVAASRAITVDEGPRPAEGPALVPLVDMFNMCDTCGACPRGDAGGGTGNGGDKDDGDGDGCAAVRVTFNGTAFNVVAARDIARGEELLVPVPEGVSSLTLAASHGFVPRRHREGVDDIVVVNLARTAPFDPALAAPYMDPPSSRPDPSDWAASSYGTRISATNVTSMLPFMRLLALESDQAGFAAKHPKRFQVWSEAAFCPHPQGSRKGCGISRKNERGMLEAFKGSLDMLKRAWAGPVTENADAHEDAVVALANAVRARAVEIIDGGLALVEKEQVYLQA